MADIQLHRLISRYSTNPNQPPIPVSDSFSISEGVSTPINVIANDNCLATRTKSLVSVGSAVNCAVVASGNLVNVTGTSDGVGSFSYVVSDGTSPATGSVSLTISSAMTSVVVTDDTHTDFGDEVSTGDTLYYFDTTTIAGATVTVDTMGHVSITGIYQVGDSFTYRVNAGTIQTFTFA